MPWRTLFLDGLPTEAWFAESTLAEHGKGGSKGAGHGYGGGGKGSGHHDHSELPAVVCPRAGCQQWISAGFRKCRCGTTRGPKLSVAERQVLQAELAEKEEKKKARKERRMAAKELKKQARATQPPKDPPAPKAAAQTSTAKVASAPAQPKSSAQSGSAEPVVCLWSLLCATKLTLRI